MLSNIAGTTAVTYDRIENSAQIIRIERRQSEKLQRRASVGRDGRQGLTYFMSNRSRNRFNIEKLVIPFALQRRDSFAQSQLRPSKMRDVC